LCTDYSVQGVSMHEAKKLRLSCHFGDWQSMFCREVDRCIADIDPRAPDWITEFVNNSPVSPVDVETWTAPCGSLAFGALVLTRIQRMVSLGVAHTAVVHDPSLHIFTDCPFSLTAGTLTSHDDRNHDDNSSYTQTIRAVQGEWKYTDTYIDDVLECDSLPSGASTKEWMTRQGILPLRLSPGSQPSLNPFYTYSVYTKRNRADLHAYMQRELSGTFPFCIAGLIGSYV
jgi:hypothetical protein